MNIQAQITPSTAPVQGQLWGADALNWATLQEPLHTPLWQAMLQSTGVKAGDRVLDAGCGAGGAAVLAAHLGATVSGIDAAPALIELARRLVPIAEFKVGGLEQLPYSDRSFDVVLAANSVQYTADARVTLRELARVTVPGGKIAVAIWGKPEDCDMSVMFAAVRAALPKPPTKSGPAELFEPGALDAAFSKAGLTSMLDCDVDCPFTYENVNAFWRAQRSAGVVQAVLQSVGEAIFRKAVMDAVAPYTMRNGSIRLKNKFRYVIATAK